MGLLLRAENLPQYIQTKTNNQYVLYCTVPCFFCMLQIVECSFDMERKVWKFMRERTDKDSANHVSVFSKVMTSITDNITVSDMPGVTCLLCLPC